MMVDTTKEAHSGQRLQHHLLHCMAVRCGTEEHQNDEKELKSTPQTALPAPQCGILLIKRRPMKSELIWVRRQQRI